MVVYLRSGKETSYLIVRLAPNYKMKIVNKQYKKVKEVIKIRYLINKCILWNKQIQGCFTPIDYEN